MYPQHFADIQRSHAKPRKREGENVACMGSALLHPGGFA